MRFASSINKSWLIFRGFSFPICALYTPPSRMKDEIEFVGDVDDDAVVPLLLLSSLERDIADPSTSEPSSLPDADAPPFKDTF